MLPTLWDILESINPHKNHLKNCCSLDCVKKATLVRRTKHLWSKFSYQTNYSSSHQMSTLITISKDLAPTRPVQGIAPWRSCALLIDMKGSSIKKMVTTVRMIRVKTIGNVGRYTLYNHISFILWTSTRTSTYCWKREPKDPVAPPRLLHFWEISCFSSFLCPPSDAEAQLRRLACVSTVLKFAEFSNCNTGFPSLFRFNFCQSFSFHFLAVVCFCLHSFEISNPILAIDFSGLSDSFSWVTLHPPAFLSHHRFILIR